MEGFRIDPSGLIVLGERKQVRVLSANKANARKIRFNQDRGFFSFLNLGLEARGAGNAFITREEIDNLCSVRSP